MANGIWMLVVVPAVIAFLFAIWVTTNVFQDIANRDETVIDPLQGAIQGGPPQGAR